MCVQLPNDTLPRRIIVKAVIERAAQLRAIETMSLNDADRDTFLPRGGDRGGEACSCSRLEDFSKGPVRLRLPCPERVLSALRPEE